MHKPRQQAPQAPATGPAHGTFAQLTGSAATGDGHAYWNGSRWVAPATVAPRSLPRLLIPHSPGGRAGAVAHPAFPSTLYGSTQVDSATTSCSNPSPNEPSVAQSSDDPNDIVVAAQAYVDATGACDDSHAWVFYSHDGGQHWKEEVIPGTTAGLASGDVGVVYDPKDHVFVYSFLQFSRTTSTDSVNAESSSDGANWFDLVTLDSNPGALDKVMVTVNQDPSSTNYGRVLVAWRDDHIGQNAFIDAFSDNGGGSWTGSSDSINIVPDCGNGVSPAFDANGDAMAAWWDCNGGSNIKEERSTDGGASWAQPSDTVISAVTDIGSSGAGGACALNAGGSSFRCNSFPSLAGDPNPADAGGTAFFVVFANWESTTQSAQTANVSQLRGLSTVDGGTTWSGGGCCSFDYMAFDNFGDKFFPWTAFAPNGRLNVGFSDREASASSTNPNGLSFNEGQSEASSLTSLRANSYIAYTADSTLGNPGSLTFIGDYDGIQSQDNHFDTFPVWTDVRNGTLDVRTMDLCYSDCPTSLAPETPLALFHPAGSTFTDLYQFNTDAGFGGAGGNFWNAVGVREGSDGTSVDDDIGLWNSRYFNNRVAEGSFSPPFNDYVLENDNSGHGPTQPYFVDVHNFSTSGGSYAVEWAHGHITLGTSFSDSMGTSNVVRVYDMFDATGTTYHLGLRPAGGNSSNYRVSVHLNGNGTYQGAPAEAATSGNVAQGKPAFVTADTGASPTGFDAVVVQNNNGGSGTYTLYRDTAVPTGTIKIDGGAASTNSTTLQLTLSATNPTAGDPVAEMAFSVNGGPYGAFRSYSTSATVTVPAVEGTQTVSVEYRNRAGGVSSPATSTIYLVQSPPTVSSFSPPSGITGSTVTLNGTHFAPHATVKFGGLVSPKINFASATKMQAIVPDGAVPGTIAVTTPAGTGTSSTSFTPSLSITGFSPASGPAGTVVTITGVGFNSTSSVKFNATTASTVNHVSSTQLKATVPAGATTGPISVTNTTGVVGTVGSAGYYAVAAPTVTSFSPASGITGSTITINGTNFVPGSSVKFGTLPWRSASFVSATQLHALVPNGAVPGKISVMTPAGTGTSTTNFTPTLSITSLSPSSGPTGTVVTINGVGFNSTSAVKFNGTTASTVNHVSSTQLKATVPAGATTGPITVTNTTGVVGTVSSAASYTVT
ncbi:MAG TPA: IPT/TIG domain-containing protein [Solirubrobacteraceae bacterium]